MLYPTELHARAVPVNRDMAGRDQGLKEWCDWRTKR